MKSIFSFTDIYWRDSPHSEGYLELLFCNRKTHRCIFFDTAFDCYYRTIPDLSLYTRISFRDKYSISRTAQHIIPTETLTHIIDIRTDFETVFIQLDQEEFIQYWMTDLGKNDGKVGEAISIQKNHRFPNIAQRLRSMEPMKINGYPY